MGFAPTLRALALFALAACADARTDSGADPDPVPVITLADQPIVEMGARVDAALAFTRIRRTVLLPDGDMLVANEANPPVLVRFDSAGQTRWIAGRQGAGPGEFRMIGGLFLVTPDTVVVYDPAAGRLTYLRGDGTLIGTTSIERYPDPRGPRAVVFWGLLRDGSFIALHNYENERSQVEGGRYRIPVLRVAADGEVLTDPLALIPGSDLATDGRRPLFSRAPVVLTDGYRLLVAGFDSLRVEVMNLESGEISVFFRPIPSRPVTARMLEALKEWQLAQARDRGSETGWRRQVEERFAHPVHRNTLPVVQSLISNLPAEIWVQHYWAPTDSVRTWTVFDGTGAIKGELNVPRAFAIMDVADDRVAGVWRGEYDVESVRVYRRLDLNR